MINQSVSMKIFRGQKYQLSEKQDGKVYFVIGTLYFDVPIKHIVNQLSRFVIHKTGNNNRFMNNFLDFCIFLTSVNIYMTIIYLSNRSTVIFTPH